MKVRLTHIDGKLPNLALMKLSHWHKSQGDEVHFTYSLLKDMFENDYDIVYGSSIFTHSLEKTTQFTNSFPDTIIGGTGTTHIHTIEQIIGDEYEYYDYSIYPDYRWSIGFSQRGCRLKCGFCVVPKKEGLPKSVNSIYDIWRGEDHPKNIVLLDNDFFGQQEWKDRVDEIIKDDFRVCLTQGINSRVLTKEQAKALVDMKCYDLKFKSKSIFTAWDNLKDEKAFFRGIQKLKDAGYSMGNITVYMLIGYDIEETEEKILHRYEKLREWKLKPYPMVFDIRNNLYLRNFQRWVLTRACFHTTWEEYKNGTTKKYKKIDGQTEIFRTVK